MGFLDFLGDSYGAFVGYVTAGVFFLLVSTYVIREVCFRRWGIDVCPGAAGSLTRARQRRQELEDERAAMELQQEIEQENRRNASTQRREERRAKYVAFLKPYTMVIREDDFCRPHKTSVSSDAPEHQPEGPCDIETGIARLASANEAEEGESTTSVPQFETRDDDHMLLTLPVVTEDGKPRRVEASCSICLMEYEEGESVIWSTRKKCPHAFHDECILEWLSKGKKRCPCCRNFFVPGQSVDDKKFIVDDCADELVTEECDGEATEEAIIEEIRASAHSFLDISGPPSRRRSLHEQRLTPLPPEAEPIAPTNTV